MGSHCGGGGKSTLTVGAAEMTVLLVLVKNSLVITLLLTIVTKGFQDEHFLFCSSHIISNYQFLQVRHRFMQCLAAVLPSGMKLSEYHRNARN